jgi:pimeloyl-ACP methyl ester carboxylesterase
MQLPPVHRRPSRPAVVLLHSSAASSRQWDSLAERLEPSFSVHAIDLHGHGRQPAWAGPRPLALSDDVALVQPVLERAGGAHVIGHSYGGAVAVHLAAERPALVRSLAVYEPVLFALLAEQQSEGAAAREAFDVAARMRESLAAGDAEGAAQRFVDYWSGAPVWDRWPAERRCAVVARMPVVVQHFDALYGAPLAPERLARLTMPMLCLTGACSTAAARRISELLRDRLPLQRHETLPGLTHMGPIARADVVNDILAAFVGVPSTTPQDALEAIA